MTLRLSLVLPFGLWACAPTYLLPEDGGAAEAAQRLGNWAEEDTDGVGTHRVVADALNVRSRDGAVVELAVRGQQLVRTTSTYVSGGSTFHEVVFKGGDLDASTGWVAGEYLAYTELRICRAAAVSVRSPSDLGRVVSTASDGDRVFVTSGTVRNTGTYRYFLGSVGGVDGWIATDFLCTPGGDVGGDAASVASGLLDLHADGTTVFWDETFGRSDGASPLDNLVDAAAGRPAATSCYGGAPCSEVYLERALLDGMSALATRYGHSYFVTAVAGASHSAGSLHYAGRAFDLDEIDGVRITGDTTATRRFMDACRALGAVEVFGPSNDPVGHGDHLHCAW
jgi:hypothetical protein